MIRWAPAVLVAWSSSATALCVMPTAGDATRPLAQGVEVPTNLAFLAPSPFPDDYMVAVPEDGGQPVVFTANTTDDLLWLLPDRELQPATNYSMCPSSGLQCVAFRTSDGPDLEAPDPPVASVTKVEGRFALDSECHGYQNATIVVVEGQPGPDTASMTLSLALGTEEEVVHVVPVKDQREPVALIDRASEGGDATYRVVAYDFAGNASAPTDIVQSLGCPGACTQATTPQFGALAVMLMAANIRRMRRRALGEQSHGRRGPPPSLH